MKRFSALLITLVLIALLTACAPDSFGHEIYTDVKDYQKIFELQEMRTYDGELEDLFPESVDNLEVKDFYCEWELGIVGSADVEIHLAVEYPDDELKTETQRLESLADGKLIYDTENFSYPAYVSVLGYMNTSIYALVDEDSSTVHYVFLQLLNEERIDMDKELLPKGYSGFGDVQGTTYNVYESVPAEFTTLVVEDI